MALDGEADLLDLAEPAQTPAEAWTAALRLAAAHRSSELSAWCSLNKKMLLTKGFTAFARQAVAVLGDKVGLITRVLPGDYAMAAGMDSEPAPREGEAPWEGSDDADLLLGQVNVRLFGGFQVERGGHVATDAIWRRRRACIIAARLVLAAGAFVGRKDVYKRQDFICSLSDLIKRLVIDHLHLVGDIFDRGGGASKIMDRLSSYHSFDIQWGNHDLLWMGAAAGQPACIVTVLRNNLRYGNYEILENDYGTVSYTHLDVYKRQVRANSQK